MAQDIDTAFVRQFEKEVHVAYQRQGSKLRGSVRTKNGIVGEKTTFQKVGKGVAGKKARHGKVPVMNLDHSTVDCTLEDWYAGEWIDRLDELKINHNEREVVVNAAVWALGRKSDELIINALATASSVNAVTLTSAAAVRNAFLLAKMRLGNKDVPDDGRVFCLPAPSVEALLMTVDAFASADYVGPQLPYINMKPRTWLGLQWLPAHTGLPIDGNDVRKNFIFHMNAAGHAIGAEVTTDVDWHNDYASFFFANWMSQGACLIDDEGVEVLTVDETSLALPTS